MNDQSARASRAESDPRSPDAAVDPLDRQAIRRVAEIGIDPRRVALALGLPLHLLDVLIPDADD